MSMMTFSRGPHDPGEVRREIMDRRSDAGVRNTLYSVIEGKETSEAAAAMHDALTAAGYDTSRESVEAALEELAAALRTPATDPEPPGSVAPEEQPEPVPEPEEQPEASDPDEEPFADVVELFARRPASPETVPEEIPREEAGSADTGSADPLRPTPASGDREAAKALYHLVDHDVTLEVREGKLYAGRETGLTPRLREMLRAHEKAIVEMLDEESVAAALPEATGYVSAALRRLGCERDGPDGREARKLLTMAGNSYERREYALARYRLRRAAMIAAGRLA